MRHAKSTANRYHYLEERMQSAERVAAQLAMIMPTTRRNTHTVISKIVVLVLWTMLNLIR